MKLELQHITKKFGDFAANEDIDLTVLPGQVHALLGENGAGKSTLMNVLYGIYEPTSGQILIDDKPVHFAGPREAMRAGIGMVHQHFMLVEPFTVAENVALGDEVTGFAGSLDLAATRKKIAEISDRYGFKVDPDAVVEDLPVGVRQRVEIIKALVRNADILIFDEPTAVLTPQETDELMQIITQLKDNGKGIVFISHKLREVKELADTITVIRRGRVVGSAQPDASAAELAELMVGRSVQLTLEKKPPHLGEVNFEVKNLSVVDKNGQRVLDDISFSIADGEVLAIAGVQGNGQTELTEAIMGMQDNVFGSITLRGQELVGLNVRKILAHGIGFVPEDRSIEGLVGDFSVAENLILDKIGDKQFATMATLKRNAITQNARAKIREFDIRVQGAQDKVSALSGGNQQKVVMARELAQDLNLFIASQPTRGVDVGSIEFLHQRIVAERDSGTPVLIVSTELEEVSELADRIAVLYAGKLMGIVPANTPREVLGCMMAGLGSQEAVDSDQL